MAQERQTPEELSPLEEKLLIALWQNRGHPCHINGLAELIDANLGLVHRSLSALFQKKLVKRTELGTRPKDPILQHLSNAGERAAKILATHHPDTKYGRCRPPQPRRQRRAKPEPKSAQPTTKERILQALPHISGPQDAQVWATQLNCSRVGALTALNKLVDEGLLSKRKDGKKAAVFGRVPEKTEN